VDIANGAPTGTDATNRIVLTWSDARGGLNHEQALVQFSDDSGVTWSNPIDGADVAAGDRPDFPAIAISPNGTDIYLTYMAFSTPWQTTTASSRPMQGVVRHAAGDLTGWSTLQRGASGDARASSANALIAEFLGDYSYAVATRSYGLAVWTDLRNAVGCPAIDAYRQSLVNGTPIATPAPGSDCPGTFGNTDIFAGP
jgi:hypothetical protein